MTTAAPCEAPANDNALFSFDGRVLEVFGYIDDARYHLWERPRLEFDPGRRRRLAIVTRHGRRLSVPYDAHLLPGLQALAEQLARSLAEAPEH
ncbi:hypothetical protein OHT57_37070 [Streptomyces sp. NBC_00285]|uniref:hypothetical protein n=1 Tax=Streptomyces sp. NBC_00285 TaxID=2975700 RepID=UPI002E2A4488|nr:hypothetical protein [Streptomyces sp. NBC_00285]